MSVKIYKITNKDNGMIYIGQTRRSLSRRWTEHCYDSNRKENGLWKYNYPLYEAIRKFGKETFSIELLEEVDDLFADDCERKYIQYYHSAISDPNCHGYNMMIGGRKNSQMLKYNSDVIVSMHNDGNTMREIAEQNHINRRTVYDVLHRKEAYDSDIVHKNMESIKRGVVQIDPDTKEILNIFESRCAAARAVGAKNHCHISEAANGKKEMAHGYIWENC